MDIDKVAKDKCGIDKLTVRDNRILDLMKQLNAAKDPALIMILCDKVTDVIMGYDTNGFKIR